MIRQINRVNTSLKCQHITNTYKHKASNASRLEIYNSLNEIALINFYQPQCENG